MAEAESFDVLGIPISMTTLQHTADLIVDWKNDTKGRYICVRDIHSLMVCRSDAHLLDVNKKAALVTPDGMPLVWIGRKRGLDLDRTNGPDLMELMLSQSAETGLKHYLFGGKPGVAEKLKTTIEERHPGVDIVGHEFPPFRPQTDEETKTTIENIKKSGADVVWVGISSPKQDMWMAKNSSKLPQTLIGVGAAFDFLSNEVRRAPYWMQRSGLEWLHRLWSEPTRLWRRYLVIVPSFVVVFFFDSLKRRIGS